MIDENKRNIHYFEADSMARLFDSLQAWQNENEKRFLSICIEIDHDKFCCIALTNPTEVVITDASGAWKANVTTRGGLYVNTQLG
ncbi:MAG: hypothetical protein ABSE70_09955 [Candidatus Limnocylindrales bacterium]